MRPASAHLAGAIALTSLGVLLIYPLAVILARSFGDGGVLLEVVQNSYYRERLGFTFFQALLSTLLTVLAALPSALLFARYEFPGKRLMRSAFTVPFVMPSVVAAIGFLSLFGPRGLTGLDLRGSFGIVLLAHVFYNFAVVVRIVSAYLEALGPKPREAAATLGASSWRILWRLTLPLALPAIVAAATLVFIFTFTSFGVILILGPRFATLEVEIYRLSTRLLELESAAVLVIVQLLVIGLATWVYTRIQARLAVTLKAQHRTGERPGPGVGGLLALNFGLAGVLVLAPLLALVLSAFWSGAGPGLQNFSALAEPARSVGFTGAGLATFNSLRFAGSSMLAALVLGFCFAYAVVRGGWHWLDTMSLLPLATSAVTLGYGYLLAFPGLSTSAWGIVVAHSLIAFPFVTRSLLPALRGLPTSLLGAAATLGAGPWRILSRIELPLLMPSLIAAAAFAFAVSIGEFGAALVLQRPEYATIPVAIFDRLGRPGPENYGTALALSVLLMLLTGSVMMLLERFGQGEW